MPTQKSMSIMIECISIPKLYSNNFIKWKQKMVAKTKPIRNDKVPSFLKYLSIPKTTHQD